VGARLDLVAALVARRFAPLFLVAAHRVLIAGVAIEASVLLAPPMRDEVVIALLLASVPSAAATTAASAGGASALLASLGHDPSVSFHGVRISFSLGAEQRRR
jgi:hypothetical protein